MKHELLLNEIQSLLCLNVTVTTGKPLKTPFILSLVAYISKTNLVTRIFYFWKVIRRGSWNFLQSFIIIYQTHYENSDWSRTFNQFTIACELDMINVISAADITFIMSSSTSAWLLSPLECSPQKQNGWTLRFCFWGWIMWKMYNKTIIEFGFRMISWIIKTSCLCYLP